MKFVRVKHVLVAIAAVVLMSSNVTAARGYEAQAAVSSKYKVDSVHSSIGFAVKHLVISTVRGSFGSVTGEIVWNEDNPTLSSFEGRVNLEDINTNNKKRDGHLKSGDFFDAQNHPTITLVSKKIRETKEKNKYKVAADLTMRGVTKMVSFDMTVSDELSTMGKNVRAFEAEFDINRQDFGVSWSKAMDGGGVVVADDVTVKLEVQAFNR